MLSYSFGMRSVQLLLLLLIGLNSTVQAQNLTIDQVINAFKSAGLEVEKPVKMGPKDFGFAPYVGEQAVRFFVPTLCEDCSGRIFSVESNADRERLSSYYIELGKRSAILFSWVFVYRNIVVQINGDLSEEKAMQYKRSLEALK